MAWITYTQAENSNHELIELDEQWEFEIEGFVIQKKSEMCINNIMCM